MIEVQFVGQEMEEKEMSQELQLGKYEFYPYEFDKDETPTLEELKKLLRKAKVTSDRDVKTPSRSWPAPTTP